MLTGFELYPRWVPVKRAEQIFMSDCQLAPVQFQYRRKGVALEVD